MKKLAGIVVLYFCCATALAQTTLPIPRNLAALYNKGTRTSDGKPGPAYWQNTANYNLQVDFNPATRLLKGLAEIEYTNNSPDTLKQIVFRLYPNIYKKGTQRLSSIEAEDLTDGVQIDTLFIQQADSVKPLKRRIQGTNMFVTGQPLLPGAKRHFTIRYHYTVTKDHISAQEK
jgi:hypothetical protein